MTLPEPPAKERDLRIRMRKKQKVKWATISRDFSHSTTIHGFGYIARSSNVAETVFWSLSLLAGFVCTILMVKRSVEESQMHPIMTTISSTPVVDTPFPAVTISANELLDPKAYSEAVMNGLQSVLDKEASGTEALLFQGLSRASKKFLLRLQRRFLQFNANTSLETLYQMRSALVPDYIDVLIAIEHEKLAAMMTALAEVDPATAKEFEQNITKDFFGLSSTCLTLPAPDGLTVYDQPLQEALAAANISTYEHAHCKFVPHCSADYRQHFLVLFVPMVFHSFCKSSFDVGTFGLRTLDPSENLYFEYFEPFVEEQRNATGPAFLTSHEWVTYLQGDMTRSQSTYFASAQVRWGCRSNLFKAWWNEYAIGEDLTSTSVPPCENATTLSKWPGVVPCCRLDALVGKSYQDVLKVMRFAQQGLSPILEAESRENQVGSSLERGKATPRINDFRIISITSEPEEADLLDKHHLCRSFTNQGLAYTFNQVPFWSMHARSKSNGIFQSLMCPRNDPNARGLKVMRPLGSGPEFEVTIVLNDVELKPMPGRPAHGTKAFKVTLHEPDHPADLQGQGVLVKRGLVTHLRITPRIVQSDAHIEDMSLEKRGCRFKHETDHLQVFTTYSRTACILECHVQTAGAACRCIPWNYPQLAAGIPMCGASGAFCFRKRLAMARRNLHSCSCPQDCDSIIYDYSLSTSSFYAESECAERGRHDAEVPAQALEHARRALPSLLFRLYDEYIDGEKYSEVEHCTQYLQKLAVLKLTIATETATVWKQSKRVSFADFVSGLGGTIGLFAGMSLFSVAELLFWAVRLVLHGLLQISTSTRA